MTRFLGIDLAAQPAKTGVVRLAPRGAGRWDANELDTPADDDALVEAARSVDVIGVDAPLGWPTAFVAAVDAHSAFGRWPNGGDRTDLTHRATDHRVTALTGRSPLSVSADKLGIVAMRCALLQQRWADEVWRRAAPRDGSGPLIEAYPAAAMRAWGIDPTGYKGGSGAKAEIGRKARASIFHVVRQSTDEWLDLSPIADRCVASDHVLDGLFSALVAVAAHTSMSERPSDPATALVEGWIHVPTSPLADVHP